MKKFFLIFFLMFNRLVAMVNVNNQLLSQSKIILQQIFTDYLEASNNHLVSLESSCNNNKPIESYKKNKLLLESIKKTNECQKKFLLEYQKVYVYACSFQILLEENTIDLFRIGVSSLIEFMKNMQDQEKESYDCQLYNSLCVFYKAISEEESKNIKVKSPNKIAQRIQFFEQLSKKESQNPKLPEKVQLS